MPGPLLLLFVRVTIVCSHAEQFLSEEGCCTQCSGSAIEHRRSVSVCVCLFACMLVKDDYKEIQKKETSYYMCA